MKEIDVFTLLSGNIQHFENWIKEVVELECKCILNIRLLNNSDNLTFTKTIKSYEKLLNNRFNEVSILNYLEPYKIKNSEYMEVGKHLHVANLYKKLFSTYNNDLVLTFEEDMIPPKGSINKLLNNFNEEVVGAIGSAYSSPLDKNVVCAANGKEGWENPLYWNELNGCLTPVDYIGGGFTLWNLRRIRKVNIRIDWTRFLGWDAILCEEIKRLGMKIILANEVVCIHNNDLLA